MSRFNKEEQNLIDFFDSNKSKPSKSFERNLDKAMQETLLAKKSSFFASFSFYVASVAIVIFAGILSASLLYVFSNSSQQAGNNIRILSDSEKVSVVQSISSANINFLKVPEIIEEQIDVEENTKINKTSVLFTQTPYTPVCKNYSNISEYNIYTYTEAGSVYVKEEIIAGSDKFEKITKDSEPSGFYLNSIKTQDELAIEMFEAEDLMYKLDDSSLAFDTNQNSYVYKLKGNIVCSNRAAGDLGNTPLSYTESSEQNDSNSFPFDREIYVNESDFKITSEIIRQENGTQIYYTKNILTSQIDATVTNVKSVFKIDSL